MCGIPGTVLCIGDGLFLCEECLDYYCFRCSACGQYYDTEDIVLHGNRQLCERCADSLGLISHPEEQEDEASDIFYEEE